MGTFAKWGRIFESSQYTVYIAGNFREWWKIDFSGEKTFADCSLVSPKQNATRSNFAEKTFANSQVFSLESFPLHGSYALGLRCR